MNSRFSIIVDRWLPSDSTSEVEKETTAEISIAVGENYATQVEDFQSKTVLSTIRVAAEPLAKWLLANWWRLRWETEPVFAEESLNWAMSHSTAAIGGGYIWPDLVFSGSDGSRISIVCKRHVSPAERDFSPVRFLSSFESSILAEDFDAAVRSFVETVLSRLESVGVRKSELHELSQDLEAEWKNRKLTSHRKLEALLGLEPDENATLVSSLLKSSKWFGEGAVEEISAASRGSEVERVLAKAKALSKTVKAFAEVPNFGVIASHLDNADLVSEMPPWQRGQSMAYALREAWELGSSPVSDADLAERLGLDPEKLRGAVPESPLSFGVRNEGGGKVGFVVNRTHDHGRRFDIARLIGGYIAKDTNDRLVPVTGAVTARQKFQRAFAAEFLCPSRMIQDRYSAGIDQQSLAKVVDEISAEYNVAERVVIHHMENRDVLAHEIAESSLLFA